MTIFVLSALRRRQKAARKRAEVPTFKDAREGVAEDMTTTVLHPTKGLRVISGKRIRAQLALQMAAANIAARKASA